MLPTRSVRPPGLSIWTIGLLILLGSLSPSAALAQTQTPTAQQTPNLDNSIQQLEQDVGAVQLRRHRATGMIGFLRLHQPADFAAFRAQNATPATKAQLFFTQYGDMFGITAAATQLQLRSTQADRLGGQHIIYQQMHQGIEVFGGQLRVHFDAAGRLTTVNGTAVPDVQVNPIPAQSAQAATQTALTTVTKQQGVRNLSIHWAVLNTHLYIFRTGLAQGIPGRNHLAYAIEVANPQRTIHEVVYVDAHSGQVLDQISLVEKIDRRVYDGDFDPTFQVWMEGDPQPYTGANADDINHLIDYSAAAYNFFATLSDGTFLSWDGADGTLHNVLIPDDPFACPNAFWNGLFTGYCPGVTGDDTVGHEWTHAYTQSTHELIYQWQPGALNEAYSDIFGETIDLLTDGGLDQPGGPRTDGACSIFSGVEVGDNSYRWLLPEDNVNFGGAFRDLWNPTCYGHAGKVSDEAYFCARFDNGGVHLNSGIANHGYALLVDGGTYNGQTVKGLGLTKAAHIYWRAATVYQTPVSQFADHADALTAACQDLATAGGELPGLSTQSPTPFGSGETITAADCAELDKAIAAVEFYTEPVQCQFQPTLNSTAPALCAEQGDLETIALADWESGLGDWTVGRRDVLNPETFAYQDWQLIGDLPADRPGQALFADNDPTLGNCVDDQQAGVRFVESPVIHLPADIVTPHIAVDHLLGPEFDWDGGNLKIRVNGGRWQQIPPAAFTFNPYNLPLLPPGFSDNPMAGEAAFTGENPNLLPANWGQSQINLAGLAAPGDQIQVRVELGTDGCFGLVGWYVDDVRVYACSAATPPLPRNTVLYFSSSTSGKVGGVKFSDEDILAYDTRTAAWSIYFDGSNVGVGALDVDAFEVLADGSLLLSFNEVADIAGIPVDDSDIVRFTPTSLGHNQTVGDFSLYLVGADVGLDADNEDIDAISFAPAGLLLISTNGKFTDPQAGIAARDEDLVAFYNEFGIWAPLPYLTGAQLGLTSNSEDVGAAWVDPLTGEIYLTTKGNFKLNTDLRGHQDDVVLCDPLALWDKTACVTRNFWDGASTALRNERIDGFSVGSALPTPAVNAAQVVDEETIEAEDEMVDADDVLEEGSQEEQQENAAPRVFLPMMGR